MAVRLQLFFKEFVLIELKYKRLQNFPIYDIRFFSNSVELMDKVNREISWLLKEPETLYDLLFCDPEAFSGEVLSEIKRIIGIIEPRLDF